MTDYAHPQRTSLLGTAWAYVLTWGFRGETTAFNTHVWIAEWPSIFQAWRLFQLMNYTVCFVPAGFFVGVMLPA